MTHRWANFSLKTWHSGLARVSLQGHRDTVRTEGHDVVQHHYTLAVVPPAGRGKKNDRTKDRQFPNVPNLRRTGALGHPVGAKNWRRKRCWHKRYQSIIRGDWGTVSGTGVAADLESSQNPRQLISPPFYWTREQFSFPATTQEGAIIIHCH